MEKESQAKLDISEVFDKIGSFGLYQKRLVLLMAYVGMFVGSCMTKLPVFTAAEPLWGCDEDSLACNVTGMFSPTNQHYKLRCSLDEEDWRFDEKFTSIITEWNLICDESILQGVAQSMVFVGWFIGLILFGIIADKRGRKPVLISSSLLAVCSSFITAFSPAIWFYILGRLITGIGLGGAVMAMIIIPSEFCQNAKVRGIAATAPWIGWSVGNWILPLSAYFLRNWRHLIIALSVPGVLILFFWWLIDESPRWLLVSGRVDEAHKVLEKVGRVNKRAMPPGRLSELPQVENTKKGNVLELFRNAYVIKITLIMWFIWFAVSLQAYGTVFASVAMSSSPYLNSAIVGSAGIPCIVLSIFLQEKFGRRVAITLSFLVALVFSVIALLLPQPTQSIGEVIGQAFCFFVINLTVGSAFNVVYVYTAELYPTTVRNVGMSWCSAMARVGSFASPYIIWMQRIHAAIPMSIMGMCSLAAALMILLLRETKSAATLETFDEMDQVEVQKKENQGENKV